MKLIDLTGQRFGGWTVLGGPVGRGASNEFRWLCRCECGQERAVLGQSLRAGKSRGCRSCGSKYILYTHGGTGTRLFRIWQSMKSRCGNLNYHGYHRYGGRGIKVCPEWRKDFVVFKEWAEANGYQEGLVIDRIDNDGNYEPDNCQFLTKSKNSLKAWHIDRVTVNSLKEET